MTFISVNKISVCLSVYFHRHIVVLFNHTTATPLITRTRRDVPRYCLLDHYNYMENTIGFHVMNCQIVKHTFTICRQQFWQSY